MFYGSLLGYDKMTGKEEREEEKRIRKTGQMEGKGNSKPANV